MVGKLARLAELEATTSTLRHDLRGMLALALLVVDRLLAPADPKVVKAEETVLKAIERMEQRLGAPARERVFRQAARWAMRARSGNCCVLSREFDTARLVALDLDCPCRTEIMDQPPRDLLDSSETG